jgi:hypothetical protein
MKTTFVKRKGKSGGILGFKKIILLESFIELKGIDKEKQYKTYYFADCDGELEIVDVEDLHSSLSDYSLGK